MDSPELQTWSMYNRVSIEARVMNKLYHPNILGLLGIYLQPNEPISIMVELAPKGDLQSVVKEFKDGGTQLSSRIIRVTLIQVCVAV